MAIFEEASPICRGKNLSWETVLLFFNSIPKQPMPKADFNSHVEKKINAWTQTHSQIARQLAFYYEEDGICYPRFTQKTSLEELFEYMNNWATRYFIPNPYAPSLKGHIPTCIYSFIVKSINEGRNNFDEILDSIFQVRLSSHDKVNVFLSGFTDLLIDNEHQVILNKGIPHYETVLHPEERFATDHKQYFEYFSISKNKSKAQPLFHSKFPLQQIFYGAPGTGKSHTIKKTTEGVDSKFVVRTTFHPDSDYSTFVGAYKPKMEVLPRYNQETGAQVGVEKRIVYDYTPQAFLKAYTTAWQNPEQPVYLIIEEINRGNCAQIFGDIFQLLDRGENGESCYPIKADQDIQMHLMEVFADNDTLPQNIRSGEELVLPRNLYIWATMNTSDQSLFPIDSAFKRRWEWKYVPITRGKDKDTGKLLQWSIEAEGAKYDWWSFLEEMNKRVASITSSEDKKLGFFFCKADEHGIISVDKFVSKVMFYLWNDVFKDYPENPIATYLKEDGKEFTYGDFYTTDDKANVVVREELVTRLLDALGVVGVSEDTISSSKKRLVVKFPDGTIVDGRTQFETYLNALKKIGIDSVESIASKKQYTRLDCPLVSKIQHDAILNNTQGFSYVNVEDYFIIKGIIVGTMKDFIVHISKELDLGIDCFIER